ncbi:PHD finger protein 20-like protein 1 isoform X1 [Anneissia japonica]|uniref:PHD finger protein 20-like protein 1 isoform X1 n=1 Tax=Anneissia japonica TaxID=1529436 RepID=UPI001425BA9B|nr:PHD finger protein 20-like protein 1 isoform X1 [Anneissia japonica]XP_033124913.1 PHD finger protein 20-like protein 1 isoform X1 [Anneissia japonica]
MEEEETQALVSTSPVPQGTESHLRLEKETHEDHGKADNYGSVISKEGTLEVKQEEERVSRNASSLDAPSTVGTSVDTPLSQDVEDEVSETETNVPMSCSETSENPSSIVAEEHDLAIVKIKEEKVDVNDEARGIDTEDRENAATETECTHEEHNESSPANINVNTTKSIKDNEDCLNNTNKSISEEQEERSECTKTPSECSETGSEKLRNIRSARARERSTNMPAEGHIGTKPKFRNIRPGFTFEPGIKVEAMDYLNNWYAAKIVRVDWDAQEVQIHFEGWNARYDEWLDFHSERLRPVPRQSNRRDSFNEGQLRKYKPGEQVLARWTDCRFYPAKIISNNNGSYQVLFYDGIKKNVQAINIRDIPPSLQEKKAKEAAYEKEWTRAHSRRKMERSQSFESDSPTAPKRRLSGNNSTPVQSKRVRHASTSPRLKMTTPPLEAPRSHSSASSTSQGSSSASSNTSISVGIGSPFTPMQSHAGKKIREPLITDKDVGLLRDPTRKLAPKEIIIDFDHNKYKCEIAGCGKAFRKGSLLDYHKKYYHVGVKPSSWASSAASKALCRSRKRLSTPGAVTGVKKSNTPQPAKVQRLRSSAPASISSKSSKQVGAASSKSSISAKSPVSPTNLKWPLPVKVKVSERLKAQGEKKIKAETTEKVESKPPIKKPLEKAPINEKTSEKGKTVEAPKITSDSEKIPAKEKPKLSDVLRTRRGSGKEEKSEIKLPDKKTSERIEDRKKSTDKTEKEKDRSKDSERIKGDKVKSNDKYRSSSSSDRGRSTDKDRSEHRSSRHHHEKHKKSHKSHRHRDRDSDSSYKYTKKEDKHHRKESSYISQTEEIYVRELTPEQKMDVVTSEEGVQTEEVYGDEVVHCVCKMNEEDGFMIQCDSCFCWQHSMCVGLNQVSVPKKYICCFCQNPSGERTNAKYYHNQEWFKTGELPQFSFASDRSHNESPTLMLAAHKLTSDIHGVNEMLHGLRRKLKILQSKDKFNPELNRWSKLCMPKQKTYIVTEHLLNLQNNKLTPSMVETVEEIDSSVDSSIHEESMQDDIIKMDGEEEDLMEVDIAKDTMSKTSNDPPPIPDPDISKTESAVTTNVLLESSDRLDGNDIKSCETERKNEEAPCESTGVDVTDNTALSTEHQSIEKMSECPPDIDNNKQDVKGAKSDSLNENIKESPEEEMEVDVVESDNNDEALSSLKDKCQDASMGDHQDKPVMAPSEESQCMSEIETPADGTKESENKLESIEATEDVVPHIDDCGKDTSVAPPNAEENLDQGDTEKESAPIKPSSEPMKEPPLKDTSIGLPATSEESALKEKNLKDKSNSDLGELSNPPKQPDSVRTSIKAPIQSSDIPSTSRNIPDIPVTKTPDENEEAEKLERLDCELSLLDHVIGIQDDLEERLALIEEQVTALEAVQMLPGDIAAFKDSFDDMPPMKRHLKMLMADLKKVSEVVST